MLIEIEVSQTSLLAAEPEFLEEMLEKGLKQRSEKSREAIVEALIRRRAPHAALNAIFSWLEDNSLEIEQSSTKGRCMDQISRLQFLSEFFANTPLFLVRSSRG